MPQRLSYLESAPIRPQLIGEPVDPSTFGIVTIPVFAEPDLDLMIRSLCQCTPPNKKFEVLILINHGESARPDQKQLNIETVKMIRPLINQLNVELEHLTFYLLQEFDLSKQETGVGTARKIIMDEAARRLDSIGRTEGSIVALDADCRVAENYLIEIERFFNNYREIDACSIQFEHRTDGLSEEQKVAIQQYERHLRYYIQAQRKAGFPFAFQTIGSAMAVRVSAYMAQGGMNRRQAGEDFYFLQKFIELGRFADLNETTVFPSGRISDRVPFGTGKAVGDAVENNQEVKTYALQSFKDIKCLFDAVDAMFLFNDTEMRAFLISLPESVRQFLGQVDFVSRIDSIRSNTSSETAFRKRFFRWFNAFQLMKYLHFARDFFYPDAQVDEMGSQLQKWVIDS